MRRLLAPVLALVLTAACGPAAAASAPTARGGDVIMQRFHEGLAEPNCGNASKRWRLHYARAATRLADDDEVALALFGYVLDEVRDAGLPSEFALIPFVETRYHADARSAGGPAGLWQFTRSTARRHGMKVQGKVDERMSVVSSTEAALQYLKRLHRMFGRDWRSTVMAYNAGEGALKASRRKGGRPLSGITRSYPDKLHAIACLFDEHAKRERWRKSIARPVPKLSPRILPAGTRNLHAWARKQGLEPRLVAALNPGWHVGSLEILAPIGANAGRPAASKAN